MNFKKVLAGFVSVLLVVNISCFSNVPCANGSFGTSVCSFLKENERSAIADIASRIGLNGNDLEAVLSFEVPKKDGTKFYCSLVPLCDCEEHKNCFVRVFSEANPGYMRYYSSGKLFGRSKTLNWFNSSLDRMYNKGLASMTFLIRVNDEVVGRIGIGPLHDRGGTDTEIGYALEQRYSGLGIMTVAVGRAIRFLSLINSKYSIRRIRATAHPDNVASNKVLNKNGFRFNRKYGSSYGPRNEYFYYF